MPNLIQIKRSLTNATPVGLANGELAFTANGDVLFIGSPNGSVVGIGGARFPGVLTANQALVANTTKGIDEIRVNVANVRAIYANGGVGASGQALLSNGTGSYWGNVTSVAGSNTYVQFNDSGFSNGVAGFAFNKSTNTLTIGTATVNSTNYTGTANNATNLGGAPASAYVNTSGNFTVAGNIYFTGTNNFFSQSVDIEGDLAVGGTLTIGGNVNVIGANNLSIVDNMIYLNANAAGNSNPDTGFVAGYYDAVTNVYAHSGIFRDHTNNRYKIFFGYTPEPNDSVNIDQTNSSFSLADFQANTVYLGNNTVYGTINTTSYSGTANNSTNLNGQPATYYTNATNITTGTLPWAQAPTNTVNTTGTFTITGLHTMQANLHTGNSTVNTQISNAAIRINGATTVNATGLYVGNATVNTTVTNGSITISGATINSTSYTGTANNSTNLNGQPASYYTNATNITTGTLPYAQLGANVIFTTNNFTITGIHTHQANIVMGNTTVNTQISNAALLINGATTVNATGLYIGNSTVNTAVTNGSITLSGATINATNYTGTANNSSYLGGQLPAYYTNATNITTGTLPYAQLGANVVMTTNTATITAVYTHQANIVTGNSTVNTTYTNSSITILNSNTMTLNASSISFGNSTVNSALGLATLTINGATIANSTGANNAFNFNGQPASYYTNATNITTGVLSTSYGGTGKTTMTNNAILVGNTTNGYRELTLGSDGQVLQSNGTTLVYATLDGGAF